MRTRQQLLFLFGVLALATFLTTACGRTSESSGGDDEAAGAATSKPEEATLGEAGEATPDAAGEASGEPLRVGLLHP